MISTQRIFVTCKLNYQVCSRDDFNNCISTALYHGNIELARYFLNRDFGAKHDYTMEGTANRFHTEALSEKVIFSSRKEY